MTTKTLSEIQTQPVTRYLTGLYGFDQLLGGGLVKGSTMLLAGQPGAGKSTMIIEIAFGLAKYEKKKVLYIAGEESMEQIKSRADRLAINSDLICLSENTEVENIIEVLKEVKPDVAIIDSLQMLHSPNVRAIAGSPSQIRSGLLTLNKYAKDNKITMIFIGHSTKGGYVAGLLTFQHAVDAVLYLGLNEDGSRFIKVNKNRFGQDQISQNLYMTAFGLSDNYNQKTPYGAIETVNYTSSQLHQLSQGKSIRPFVSMMLEWLKNESIKKGLLKPEGSVSLNSDQIREMAKNNFIMRPIIEHTLKWLEKT